MDQTLLNTSFQVVGEEQGWSRITTENGYAYIKTESLSDMPTVVRSYTDEELYILAHVICGEAQNCPDDEQLYVGTVCLYKGWELLQGAVSQELGQCQIFAGKWKRPAWQCSLAVRKQAGKRSVFADKVSQLLLLKGWSLHLKERKRWIWADPFRGGSWFKNHALASPWFTKL